MTSSPPSLVWAVPFIGLLLSVALAPLVAPRLWQRHYGKLTAFWSLTLLAPAAALRGVAPTGAALLAMGVLEYLPFALLLGSLFVIAGGLRLTGTPRGTPAVNTAMLAFGTLLASIIGTPGAAMLMIRPMIRANRHRRHSAHIVVFLILLVANVGGALTPLGNPPLFLGFLSGVPFFWPLTHLWAPTLLAAAGLLVSFYALDSYVLRRGRRAEQTAVLPEIEKLGLEGWVNLPLLALVMGAVLLRAFWHPDLGLPLAGLRWNAADIAADALFAAAALASLALTAPHTRRRNDFAWEPMIEVAVLFAGIFITLIPVTAMMAAGARGPAASLFQELMPGGAPRDALFYWATGLLSAVLDNAPSYLVLLQLAGKDGAAIAAAAPRTLAAISTAAVFFGALTYIGNAPNLLIRSIAESHGIRMPRFFGYIAWASLCLLPWLLLVQLVFFA